MQKLFSFVTVLLFSMAIFSQTIPIQPVPSSTPAKVSDYQKQLDDLKKWADNLTNEKFYEEHFTFKDSKSGKEQKFSDFPIFDRQMFQMTTTQRFNRYLDKFDETWSEELKKATGKVPDSKGKADVVAGVDDIANFLEELVKVRKQAVKSWEEQANNVFKDFPKEFEEKDRVLYLKNIKALKDSLEKR